MLLKKIIATLTDINFHFKRFLISLLFYKKRTNRGIIMKKIALLIILLFSITIMPGCYDGDDDMAKVRINLGNIPVARHQIKNTILDKIFSIFVKNAYAQTLPADMGVTTIHLAAIKDNSITSVKSLDTANMLTNSNTVEFSVPAGSGITIVVLGEHDYMPVANQQLIEYYGKTENPIVLAANTVTEVSISMESFDGTYVNIDDSGVPVTWNKITGATSYTVYNSSYSVLQKSLDNYTAVNGRYYMTVDFSYINRSSDYLYIGGI